MMFHEGDLQSGIALAVQEGKAVVCFVRDDEEESTKWEKEYLTEDEISTLIESKAVTLRLSFGSQEAGFLTSFCPVSKAPTLVVIGNGTLREYLAPGLSHEDFKRRLRLALDPPPVQAQASAPPAPHITNPAGDAPVSSPSGEAPRNTAQTAPLEPQTNDNEILRPSQSPRPPSRPTQDQPQAVAEPSPPQQTPSSLSENQKGKQRAVESEPAPPDARRAQHQKLRQQQLQREREQRQERQRILDQVKHDREELKYRQSLQNVSGQVHDEAPTKPQTHTTAPPSKDGTYRIQVRLFDGTSIRSTFTGHQTIRADVRSWLDTQRSDGNTPYTLKAILHPLPNKTLSISEEEEPLQDLGLGRTANLVMVPVKGYTEAYASSAPGLAYRGLSAGYNLVSGAAGAVYGALGTFLGVGQVTQNTTAQSQSTAAGGSEAPRTGQAGSGINIRTLRDQREGEGEHQLYNGNQLNFEPRRDDTGKDD